MFARLMLHAMGTEEVEAIAVTAAPTPVDDMLMSKPSILAQILGDA